MRRKATTLAELQVSECQEQRVGYREWHEQAERWEKRGVRQAYCVECARWKYPKERCRYFRSASA